MSRDRFLVCLFLYLIAFIFYFPVLFNDTHPDNLNFVGRFDFARIIYYLVINIFGLFVFKLFFLLVVSLTPVFIYLFSLDKSYGLVYGLWLVLFYDKFIYYALTHDSMCISVCLSFLVCFKRNVYSIALLFLHRIENLALVVLHDKRVVFLVVLILFNRRGMIHGMNYTSMFIPYQVNDFGFFGLFVVLAGFIGLYMLTRADYRYVYMGWVMLFALLWTKVYGDPNPRYMLQFFALWYYFAGYVFYRLVVYCFNVKQ